MTRVRINRFATHRRIVEAGPDVADHGKHVESAEKLFDELSKFYDEFSELVMPYVRMTQKLR